MNSQGIAVQALYGRSIMAGFHCVWSVAAVAGALYASGAAVLDWSLGLTVGVLTVLGVAVMLVAGPSFVRDVAAMEAAPAAGRVPWRPLLLVGVAVGAIVSRAVGDRLVGRFGPVRVVQAGTLLGMLGLVCIVASPGPWLAIAGFVVTGLGLAVVAPLAFTAAAAVDPARADVAIARLNLFNYAGTIVGSSLIGAVYASGQLRLAFAIPLVLAGLILLVARAFAPRTPAVAVAPAEGVA